MTAALNRTGTRRVLSQGLRLKARSLAVAFFRWLDHPLARETCFDIGGNLKRVRLPEFSFQLSFLIL